MALNRDRISRCLGALLFLTTSLAVGQQPPAQKVISEALAQIGGERTLRTLRNVRFQAMGHRNELEESERPEGPYIIEYDEISELRDIEHHRFKETIKSRVLMQPADTVTSIVAGGVASADANGEPQPVSRQQVQEAEENLDLGPEHVLLTALAAPDLHAEPDATMQSIPHHVVGFTWKGRPVRVFLNAYTSLPTAVEWTCAYPDDMFWSAWGDATTRVYYSAWWLLPSGIHYPLQWDFFRNQLPDRTLTITKLEFNVALRPDEFAISAESKSAFERTSNQTLDDLATHLGKPGEATELARDIVFIPGAWNTTLVRQSDGIVVLEAPISSSYSARVMAEAKRRWPGTPIKAVISTSDSWPHIAGVREYAAEGIPIYALDLNVPILSRVISAPRAEIPDKLANASRPANFRRVSGKTVIGDGANRMEVYPIRGETSERQLMVYFPEHNLLYGSDPFQKLPDGSYFYPQTVWELMHAVDREKLAVSTFFMMHIGPTPWNELGKVIGAAEEAKGAD